jgi:UDP-N-acetyl-D-mannosaminuronic acid dehydrogenase
MKTKICVIGLGYIGLPTAAILAKNGYQVDGYDLSDAVISTINDGKIHIIENNLEDLVHEVVQKSSLQAFKEVRVSDIYIICVPTPLIESFNDVPAPDISYIESAISNISNLLKDGDTIILESTSPVGTTKKIKRTLDELDIDTSKINIAYCPERVLPGNILHELIHNDRVVGGINKKSTRVVVDFYKTFVKGKIYETNSETAEMCKLTENSFRDVNIAFANELSIVCKENNIDVWELINIANKHPRVNILQPGAGVGGHCIAVDPWFIVSKNPNSSKLIKTAREVNNQKPKWVEEIILKEKDRLYSILNKDIKIGFLGLAFKPDIDDLRESPALEIVESIYKNYQNIMIAEPNISDYPGINISNFNEVIEDCDLIVILQKHSIFVQNKELLNERNDKYILDLCGLLAN